MLEVIAHTVKDIELISLTRASRIELCTNLEFDGLTPNLEFVKKALEVTKVPIRVMIRPQNTFYAQDDEITKMTEYIEQLKNLSHPFLEGFVFGYLTDNNKINIRQMEKLILASGNLTTTFHKASDKCQDDLTPLKELGVTTILTQGGENKIEQNKENLLKIKKELKDIELLLGGGVTLENLSELKEISKSIHIGSLARIDKSYEKDIDTQIIEKIVKIIEE